MSGGLFQPEIFGIGNLRIKKAPVFNKYWQDSQQFYIRISVREILARIFCPESEIIFFRTKDTL
jgi:hypothetical protein